MRLVRSSDPDAVARDQALRMLAERAVLTRSVCRELLESDGRYVSRRTRSSLDELLRWIVENLSASVRVEPHAADGIDQMVQLPGTEAIVAEISDGAGVCSAFFMLLTADNSFQADGDRARISAKLSSYWANHAAPAEIPEL